MASIWHASKVIRDFYEYFTILNDQMYYNLHIVGVREQIHDNSSYREAVKKIVLLRKDAQKPTNEYNAV
jgi:hypothetical protein